MLQAPACHVAHSCWSVLQCVAVCCSVLQCIAVCCSALQCVAGRCSDLQCAVLLHIVESVKRGKPCAAVRCSVLQRVALCSTVLQCALMCCSALQRATVFNTVKKSWTWPHSLVTNIGWPKLPVQDAFSCGCLSSKEPLITGLVCGKRRAPWNLGTGVANTHGIPCRCRSFFTNDPCNS